MIHLWILFLSVFGGLMVSANYDFRYSSSSGAFPAMFNLAEHASISANATCGQHKPEVFCALAEVHNVGKCGVCEQKNPAKAHPAEFAIDGTDKWWQSPSLQYGPAYHWVTVTINLQQVYQVAYIIITSGVSPRPANWILERSMDGSSWEAWQYHAQSDEQCWLLYGLEPRKGKPTYKEDNEVICTSFYSGLKPLEGGQISISLVNERPGARGPSRTLLEFTKARFIRLRFQGLQTITGDQNILLDDSQSEYLNVARRYFYSIQDISIGGQCPCHGHATECPVKNTGEYHCKCRHNTCGDLCDTCCPMFNQKRWRPGKFISANDCERCQCFGHADECSFDPQIEAERRSLNTAGKLTGGGVCRNCRDMTMGVNCERCLDGYFRPAGVSRFDKSPCKACSCSSPGCVRGGKCYPDSELAHLGHHAGDCVCETGFTGAKCEQCAPGYRNYPDCSPCPCSMAGTQGGQCDGDCQCKKHSAGPRCDYCKPGYFALQQANPDGCTECFCYGISSECDSAELGVEVIDHESGWKVTDISGRISVSPYWSSVTSGLTIAQEDIALNSYYWQAPEQYVGNKLVSYGQQITVHTSWHAGRGDTSGIPTKEPDVILQGANMKIGHGSSDYRGSKNATIKLVFLEHGWYHIPGGGSVTKHEFMRCMGDIERLLIRAKYHSDQLEGTLHTAAMEFGSDGSLSLTRTKAVERCVCPPGYTGLSCENCGYGYTRVNNLLYRGECRECNCNGHSATCDPVSLECGICQHNTVGPNCEECAPGFYGNARFGRPNDCKPCKCPLDLPSNNFSPTCDIATIDYDKYSIAPEGYICNACPRGYEGAHCERCSNGFYGNPLNIGDYCKPCRCSGNGDHSSDRYCHHITGECLSCLGNTGGWHCDVCLPGYYGNPDDGFCKPCNCNQYGAVNSQCDSNTGQCTCKEKYTGRTCGQCKDGFGNIQAGCRQCGCHRTGSVGDLCDADTGQCYCRPGVTGLICESCLPLHFGFSLRGCDTCDCHPKGSHREECNLSTGVCACRLRVTGRQCDRCQFGHWGIMSGVGCEACTCDSMGSVNNDCDDITGQCVCKPGVGGPFCDACLAGFWGISPRGCKKCQPCDQPGHVCDPDTGRCVCPVLTQGRACESCVPGTWDYHAYKGCKRCQCHKEGSVSGACAVTTGHCRCLEGFEGEKCEKCSHGFYNWPNCRACNCNPSGTNLEACRNGVCQCDNSGVCPCKARAVGKKCASCATGMFGLTQSNPEGCTECFCFGRTRDCSQSSYSWTQLVMPRRREVKISRGESQLQVLNNLIAIPGTRGDVVVGVNQLFSIPIYWQLPELFHGDKVLSYNGYMRFTTSSNADNLFPPDILASYPLVQLQGNYRIIIEHYPKKVSPSGRYEVRMHEDDWVEKGTNMPVTREMLMIGLQGVEQILVRATQSPDVTMSTLHGVSLDVARPSSIGAPRPALGVEICNCPGKYTATSCQDPGIGFYRYSNASYVHSEIIIDLVGVSKPCMCNGRAEACHPETGTCLNCWDNTAGSYCNICAPGFYGEPMMGHECQPCRCPSAEKNFAQTCYVEQGGAFSCQCREGYTGPTCRRCQYGYYGDPTAENGSCLPCNCNPYGSQTDQCDENTGQCYCVEGVIGRSCDRCQPRHILTTQRKCKNCNDGCVGTLLDFLEGVKDALDRANIDNIDPAPLLRIGKIRKRVELFEAHVIQMTEANVNLTSMINLEEQMKPKAELTLLGTSKQFKTGETLLEQSSKMFDQSRRKNDEITILARDIQEIIIYLQNHGRESGSIVSLSKALGKASASLKAIRENDFSESDIGARTELSQARIVYDTIQSMIFGSIPTDDLQNQVEKVDSLVNDLLQYLNLGMSTAQNATMMNHINGQTLASAQSYCTRIDQFKLASREKINEGVQLSDQTSKVIASVAQNFENINKVFQVLLRKEKDVEDKEMGFSAIVEDYYTRFVLPCQANAEKLAQFAERLRKMFEKRVSVNANQALQAANAYKMIINALDEARNAASRAMDAALLAYKVADPPGKNNLRRQGENSRIRSEDLRQEAQGLLKNTENMETQINSIKMNLEKYMFDLQQNEKHLAILEKEQDRFSYVSAYAAEARTAAAEALRETQESKVNMYQMFKKIETELKIPARELQSFSAENLGSIPSKLSESERTLQKVDKQAVYLERRSNDLLSINSEVSLRLKSLRTKIEMAKHAATSIKISITGDEKEQGACLRSYAVNLNPGVTNEVSILYGIETDDRNALLIYLPSSKKSQDEQGNDSFDFMAIEMVDRKIRFLWNNGAGTQAIEHSVEIETAQRLSRQDNMWYRITAERIGNIGRLNVRKVQPIYDHPDYHKWEVGESDPSANILDIQPADRLWVGGAPNYYRSKELKWGGKFNGVLYELSVNKKNIGIWNFITSFGCKETYSGVTDVAVEHSCLTFPGNGYATQAQIRNYDPRYYGIAMEFKTFDENALLILVANPYNGQYLSLEMREGKVFLEINYGKRIKLEFMSNKIYNSGAWVKVEAGRAHRNGVETGVLRITYNGLREDFMDTVPALTSVDLDLQHSWLYFGGLPPNFDLSHFPRIQTRSLLGNMRGITTSNPGSNSLMNPLYTEQGQSNPYYNVLPTCEHQILKSVSFRGDGHIEVKSQSLRKNSSFGFSFKTQQADALLILSTFMGKPSGNLGDFYSISLVDGKLSFIFGQGSGKVASFISERSYSDNNYHAVFVVIRKRRMTIYVDDINITESASLKLVKSDPAIKSPTQGGLFLGGIPTIIRSDVVSANMAQSVQQLVGTLKDFVFIDDISVRVVAMNEPYSFFHVAIGRELLPGEHV